MIQPPMTVPDPDHPAVVRIPKGKRRRYPRTGTCSDCANKPRVEPRKDVYIGLVVAT